MAGKPKLTRKEQAAPTKKSIFHAARDLFAERSIENTTILDIVSRAGVSIADFYLYFATKQDVFFAAHTDSTISTSM